MQDGSMRPEDQGQHTNLRCLSLLTEVFSLQNVQVCGKMAFIPVAYSPKVTRQSFEFEGKVGDLSACFFREEVSRVGGVSSVTCAGGVGL